MMYWLRVCILSALLSLCVTTITYASPADGGGGRNKNNNKLNKKIHTSASNDGNNLRSKVVGSSQESTTLRRIKIEYKDAVKMGIAYNWSKGEIIKNKSSKSSSKAKTTQQQLSSEGKQHPQYPLRLGPISSNLRHWHFSFQGCGIYSSGIYHGRILLPKDYPANPPRVQLWTPSGRFIPNHDICLSASAYHPESWTPRWTVLSLVQALRLHMLTNPQEIGGMTSSTDETLEYARKSLKWSRSWRTSGQKSITVDHEFMIRQGAFDIKEEQPDIATDNYAEETDFENDETIEGQNENHHDHQQQLHETDGFVTEDGSSRDTGIPSSFEDESQSIPNKIRKKKKKKKSKTKPTMDTHIPPTDVTRHKVSLPQSTKTKDSSRKKEAIAPHHDNRSIISKVFKVYGTPARMAILSLAILIWILNTR